MKFECNICKKDMSQFIQQEAINELSQLSENEKTDLDNHIERVICPECFEKGHCIAVCTNCGSMFMIEPLGKLIMIESIFANSDNTETIGLNGKNVSKEHIINTTYMFLINECVDCGDEKNVAIHSLINIKDLEKTMFNIKFPDIVNIVKKE